MAGGVGGIIGGFGGSAVGGATVRLLLDDAQFKSALAEDEAQFKSSTTSMGAGAAKAGSVAKAGFNALALGAGIAVAAGVNMATTFEKTFATIGVLAGKLGMPMDQAKQHVLDLAKATGQDPNGLASALYFAASAGLQASQVMPLLDISAKAAAMGMGSAQDVAKSLTSILNAYAGTGLTAAQAMNVLTVGAKDSSAEMSDFATGLGPVISTAAAAGISINDIVAAIGQVKNAGVPFARAVTGMRFLIQSLTTPTASATTALQSIGLSASDVAKMLQQPGGLVKALQLIHDKTAQMGTAGQQAWAAITGGARGAIVAVDLVGKHTDATNKMVADLGRAAQKGATDFSDAWSKISNTDAVKFQKALADVKVALIQLGEQVLPKLTPLVGKLGDLLSVVVPLAPAVLALWAAWKGYTILVAATAAIGDVAAALAVLPAVVSAGLGPLAILPGLLQDNANDFGTVTSAAQDATSAAGLLFGLYKDGKVTLEQFGIAMSVANDPTVALTAHQHDLYVAFAKTIDASGLVTASGNALGNTLSRNNEAYGQAEDLILGYNNAQGIAAKRTAEFEPKVAAAALAMSNLGDTTDRTGHKTRELATAQLDQMRALHSAEQAVQRLTTFFGTDISTLGKAKAAYKSWGSQVGQTFNDAESNLQALSSKNKATFADMQKAVQSGLQSMRDFGKNIHTITEGGGADAKKFAAYLVSLGPAGEHMAAVLAAQPPKVRASFESNFARAQTAGQTLGSTIEHAIIGGLTHVEAEVLVAAGKFSSLQAAIDALHGKSIDITVNYHYNGTPPANTGKVIP